MAIEGRMREMATEVRGYSHQIQFLFGAGASIRNILASLGEPGWRVRRIISVDQARAVVEVGLAGSGAGEAVLKISRNPAAARVMERERKLLSQLRADPRLDQLLSILPDELSWGRMGEAAFVVERVLPGLDGRTLLDDPIRTTRMQSAALDVAAVLHGRTARIVTVDPDLTNRWIDEPLRQIASLRAMYPWVALHASALKRLGEMLREPLLGRRLAVSWVHGDFFPGNLLMSPDGSSVRGLVDWDLAAADDIPVLDAMQLVIGTNLIRDRSELGQMVLRLLDGNGFSAGEAEALEKAQAQFEPHGLSMREAVILNWLRHIGCNLSKSAHFSQHRRWLKENVVTVLEALNPRRLAS